MCSTKQQHKNATDISGDLGYILWNVCKYTVESHSINDAVHLNCYEFNFVEFSPTKNDIYLNDILVLYGLGSAFMQAVFQILVNNLQCCIYTLLSMHV